MKINKGILSLICSFLCAAILIAVGAVIYHESTPAVIRGGLADATATAEESVAPVQSEPHDSYILKEYDGGIGIFTESGKLCDVLNVAIITLPLSERQRLSGGIKVNSEKELYSLIEDYTG